MADRREERRKAFRRGHLAEYLAAGFLLLKGYRVRAIRFRAKAGEVDIVARKGDLIAFVEVKARRDSDTAVFAVGHESQKRIRNASLVWLSQQPDAHRLSLRYDIVAVTPWKLPRHFIDAF